MWLYGQDAEFDLLASILQRLANRSVIDVGAERGGFTEAMLRAGAAEVHAVEPEPRNAQFLRERFPGEVGLTIHECAISSRDGEVDLYLSTDPAGEPLTYAHSVRKHAYADQVVWNDHIRVTARSLGSLAAGGEIPSRVGILKVDAEGHDLEVLAGLGALDCDVIMTEHWLDLPHSLGRCPWTIEEILAEVSSHGFEQFACFVHRGETTIVQWDDATIPVGSAGNVVLINDRVLVDVIPLVLESASALMQKAAELAERRSATIGEIDRERAIQTAVADERLATIAEIDRERAIQTAVADERLATIAEIDRERAIQTAVADERLATIEMLDRERALQTETAAERLLEIERLTESAGDHSTETRRD